MGCDSSAVCTLLICARVTSLMQPGCSDGTLMELARAGAANAKEQEGSFRWAGKKPFLGPQSFRVPKQQLSALKH